MNAVHFVGEFLLRGIGTWLAEVCIVAGLAGLAASTIMQRAGAVEPALTSGARVAAIALISGAGALECWGLLQQSMLDCLAWWPLIGQQGWSVAP